MPDNEPIYTIIDAAAVPMFVLTQDGSGRLSYAAFNTAACDRSGFRLEDVLGRTAKDLYRGRAGEIAYERHVQVARTRKPLTYEVLLPFTDNARLVRTTLQPVLDGSGRLTHLVGTSFDLSHDEFVSKLYVNAQVLNSEIEEFISVAAHDLRSPLTTIKGLAGLLKQDFEDLGDGKLDLIHLLERVSVKCVDLVSEVLSYTQTANLKLETDHFAFHELTAELTTILDPHGQHSFLQDEVWLVADRTALQVILRNLIENAIKQAGRIQVRVSLAVAEADGGFLQITVGDNGRGFDDTSQALLESTRIAGQSGFGLASIKRLITARGGTFIVESLENGQGTAVRFTFPGQIQRSFREETRSGTFQALAR